MTHLKTWFNSPVNNNGTGGNIKLPVVTVGPMVTLSSVDTVLLVGLITATDTAPVVENKERLTVRVQERIYTVRCGSGAAR